MAGTSLWDDDDSIEESSANTGIDSETEDRADDSTVFDPSESAASARGLVAEMNTSQVSLWRLITIVTMIVTASLVSFTTFRFISNGEDEDFASKFDVFTTSIEDAMNFHKKTLSSSVHQVADQVSMEAKARGETFPFVTVSFFEVIGSRVLEDAELECIYWGPYVSYDQRLAWSNYSDANQEWLRESREMASARKGLTWEDIYDKGKITPFIFEANADDTAMEPSTGRQTQPMWQMSPPSSSFVNFNIQSDSRNLQLENAVNALHRGLMSEVRDFSFALEGVQSIAAHKTSHEISGVLEPGESYVNYTHPHTLVAAPIYEGLVDPQSSRIVGHIFSLMSWDRYLTKLLPDGVSGITAVVKNTCEQAFSYELSGNSAIYRGPVDLHDPSYDSYEVVIPFYDESETGEQVTNTPGHCLYSLHIFPTQDFEENCRSNLPRMVTIVVVVSFFFLVGVFFTYDSFVSRRNRKMHDAVVRSTAIVSDLFPSNVRDRLFAEEDKEEKKTSKFMTYRHSSTKNLLKGYLSTEGGGGDESNDDKDNDFYKTKPIADLFTETTILFADIAGFTAWSSAREPSQVFVLLETIYKAFDEIAKKRRVFKVETVGDCYVAVTGLPDPQKGHVLMMCRFADDCMKKMHSLTRKLEIRLGPETTDLDMRFGIHSGPVTAGVLRGERSRFQLFGDTMNTASRIETNGRAGKIHLSQETADLLVAAGKQHWISKREDKIVAKGKGELQTYWLVGTKKAPARDRSDSASISSEVVTDSEASTADSDMEDFGFNLNRDEKTDRLVQWIVDVLLGYLKKIAQQRGTSAADTTVEWESAEGSTVLDEVSEIISLPVLGKSNTNTNQFSEVEVELAPEVHEQLVEYVESIAAMYLDNPFHNFEHASHVSMSVVKLMSRIVTPDVEAKNSDMESTLHEYTYGITSDPLTQFACVFSALIHDVDHCGIPNNLLVEENPELAECYNNKSVAEQNSVDLSWDLLQDDMFTAFREAIYQTEDEQLRFRKLVVNSVMATDIMDKDLKTLRNARWERAFSETKFEEAPKDASDRKATIVIEHLIQASDVAHTMQHWHIYRKWNVRLFEELYCAYMEGRSPSNPCDLWYKGEIGFFDFYIIPLAKKLKDCGVFGVSSDEYLSYAEKNRKEWVARGQEIVAGMIDEAHKKYGSRIEESPEEDI